MIVCLQLDLGNTKSYAWSLVCEKWYFVPGDWRDVKIELHFGFQEIYILHFIIPTQILNTLKLFLIFL